MDLSFILLGLEQQQNLTTHNQLETNNRFVLERFKQLMTVRYWTYTRSIIISTRMYEEGLLFIVRLHMLNDRYADSHEIPKILYIDHEKKLHLFHLQLLDKLDRWFEYIELFESLRQETNYTIQYSRDRVGDPVFDSYVLFTDNYKQVHFLFEQHHRYELIQRKITRSTTGKKTGNQMHHPQSELTDEEIRRRFESILFRAENDLPVFEPP